MDYLEELTARELYIFIIDTVQNALEMFRVL